MKHKPLTKDQAVIVSAYTGYLACEFSDLHAAIEAKLGRPVLTHEMADRSCREEIRAAFRSDFLALVPGKGTP